MHSQYATVALTVSNLVVVDPLDLVENVWGESKPIPKHKGRMRQSIDSQSFLMATCIDILANFLPRLSLFFMSQWHEMSIDGLNWPTLKVTRTTPQMNSLRIDATAVISHFGNFYRWLAVQGILFTDVYLFVDIHLTPPLNCLMNPRFKWVSFFGLGAVSAAVMSSADSCILSASSMFTHNIYKAIVCPSHLMIALRVSILAVAAIASVLAVSINSIYGLSSQVALLRHGLRFTVPSIAAGHSRRV